MSAALDGWLAVPIAAIVALQAREQREPGLRRTRADMLDSAGVMLWREPRSQDGGLGY